MFFFSGLYSRKERNTTQPCKKCFDHSHYTEEEEDDDDDDDDEEEEEEEEERKKERSVHR